MKNFKSILLEINDLNFKFHNKTHFNFNFLNLILFHLASNLYHHKKIQLVYYKKFIKVRIQVKD
jgi:hypothetical protein